MKLKFTEAGSRKSEVRNLTSRGRSPASSLRPPASERGVALIVTLLMLSVITFMTVTFLYLARSEKGSVSTSTEQSTARFAADTAQERAKAELLAPILAFNKDQQYDLMVSTNFINGAGFDPGAADYRTNVNYDHLISGGPLINQNQLQQNIANLLYDPRPPVIVTNRIAGSNEFRYYLDLNRNGRYDPSGFQPVIGPNGGYLHPNGSEDLNPVNVVSNFVVGDPEWIGVLEHPDQPSSASNQFVARFAYLVVPAGKTLDINYVHNQALDVQSANPIITPTTSDGYLRNEGVGPWEINLAAFLVDLNTNFWYRENGQTTKYYSYSQPFAGNQGIAFDNARSLLAYRYANNYNSLQSVFNLFGPNGSAAVRNNGIDEYDDGLLQTTTVLPPDNDQLETGLPWVGADNPNHFFTTQEYFDPAKTAVGVAPGVTNFTDRLMAAGNSPSSYDRYTFYRMLSQLGSDSAPESGKININYMNVDANGNVVPGMETNFIPWTPIQFFTASSQAMFKQLNLHDLNTNLITVTNIPIYPVNYYTPAVHRVMQLAANIFDATTNQTVPLLLGQTNAFFPSVFRPVFSRNPLTGGVFISGYQEVTNATTQLVNAIMRDLNNATDLASIPPWPAFSSDMVYGIPAVIGAKKGLPNFNKFGLQSAVTVSRNLNFHRPGPKQPVNQTNQFYQIGISNVFGVGAWNSYVSQFPRPLQMWTAVNVTAYLTNENGTIVSSNWFSSPLTSTPANPWVGLSSKIPVQASYPATNGVYLHGLGFVLSGTDPNNSFPVPHLWLNLRTQVRFMLVDTSVNPNRIVDYVNLSSTQGPLYLMDTLENGAPCNGLSGTGDPDPGIVWCTNRLGYPSGNGPDNSGNWPTPTYGMMNQIAIGLGNMQVSDQFWKAYGGQGDKTSGIQVFKRRMLDNNGSTNNSDTFFAAPLQPTRTFYQYISWQANDPLVHYTSPDLTDLFGITNTIELDQNDDSPLLKLSQDPRNGHYRPWGTADTAPSTSKNPAVKDPQAGNSVGNSDSWDFPTNKFPNVGWLGRVHRGTPWQTVYLKPADIDTNTWQKWSGDTAVDPSLNGTNIAFNADSPLTRPVRDRDLFSVFTTAVSGSATRGQMSINQSGLAAWSAILSGVIPLSNATNFNNLPILPAGAGTNSAVWQMVNGVNGINTVRSNQFNGAFGKLGDILAVPGLTVNSPFLSTNGAPINDEVIERIPQQVMSLLTLSHTPRFVVYAYGQTLKPAERSLLTSGPFFHMCTNYQVTAESATRAVVRVEGLPDSPHLVMESFNVLPPD